jgi:hypothetical protein
MTMPRHRHVQERTQASPAENKMRAFIRRFPMHYGIYRRYPLGRFPAVRSGRGLGCPPDGVGDGVEWVLNLICPHFVGVFCTASTCSETPGQCRRRPICQAPAAGPPRAGGDRAGGTGPAARIGRAHRGEACRASVGRRSVAAAALAPLRRERAGRVERGCRV